jgi:hypothetical protein
VGERLTLAPSPVIRAGSLDNAGVARDAVENGLGLRTIRII